MELSQILLMAVLWGTLPLAVIITLDHFWGRSNPLFFKHAWRFFYSLALSGFVFLVIYKVSAPNAAWDCFGLLTQAPPETKTWAAFSFIWAVAVSAILLWQALRFGQAWRAISRLPVLRSHRVKTLFQGLSSDLNLEDEFQVRIGRHVVSPFVFGFFPPKLVLHRRLLRAKDRHLLRPALAHELTHLRHHDVAWNLVAMIFTSLFFFHPLVWLARGLYHRTVERCADQIALRQGIRPQELMRATLALLDEKTPGVAVALSKEFRTLKDRFEAMSNYDRQGRFSKWKGAMLAGVLLASCAAPAVLNPVDVVTAVTPGIEVGACFRGEIHKLSRADSASKTVRN